MSCGCGGIGITEGAVAEKQVRSFTACGSSRNFCESVADELFESLVAGFRRDHHAGDTFTSRAE